MADRPSAAAERRHQGSGLACCPDPFWGFSDHFADLGARLWRPRGGESVPALATALVMPPPRSVPLAKRQWRSGLFLAAQRLQIYFVKPLQQQAINCRKLSHQTHAEALHIELALMAAPVGGFGQLPARYCPAYLHPRLHVIGCFRRFRPLRSLRRLRQRDETKYQHNGSHRTSAPVQPPPRSFPLAIRHPRAARSASGHNGQIKRAAHGYEATREAAMAAFAKSWRRE